MQQYLLTVYQPDEPPPPEVMAQMDQIMADVDAMNVELKAAGAWVFAGGLHPPSTATVLRAHGRRGADDRRSVHRGQGARRRLHHHQGRRPRRRPGVGPQARRGRPRCRSRCGRSRTSATTERIVTPVSAARDRAGVPRGVRPRGRRPGPRLRRHRHRRGGGPGRVHGRARALAATGLPPSPAGWIITTARNRAIDRLRREASRARPARPGGAARAERRPRVPEDEGAVHDDRLRLIFTCCHPALATGAQVALTLRLLGGLTTAEIARAFLVPEPTMAQRLVARQGQDPRRAASRTASRTRPTCPSGSARCWPSSTSSSTRATPRAPATGSSATTCARRRSGWRGCSPSSCPTSRRCSGCWR